MAFHLYILRCSDGSYYTGHTEGLEQRLAAHHAGTIGGYTQSRRPVRLVFTEEFPTRLEALEAERRVKGWSRDKKEALIARDWALLLVLGNVRGPRRKRRKAD
ncbi:MAG: GIY-YIG nuclease family protein [Dehalococcoidia bacterium]